MYCKNCGNKSEIGKKFCTNCGNSFPAQNFNEKDVKDQPIIPSVSIWQKINTSKIVMILVVAGFIAYGAYSNRDEASIDTNNKAITAYDSGDSTQAIAKFQEASQSASTNETKIQTLKNLGYVYATEGQNDLALNSFKEALTLAKSGSFDYYLISGEIAVLEGKPNAAQLSYTKAYEISPNNFQINNALNLFYLDLEEIAPSYSNYPKALIHAKKAYEVSDPGIKSLATKNLGIAHMLNENYDQAISFLSPYANSDVYSAFWLGLAYLGKEDHINAKIHLRRALNGGVEMPQEIIDYLNS